MIRIGWAHYTITTIANPQNRVSVIIEAPIICFAALKRGRGSGGGLGLLLRCCSCVLGLTAYSLVPSEFQGVSC